MTRGYIKQRIRQDLREKRGSEAWFRQATLDEHIDNAVADIARASYCYEATESIDLVNGQQDYCASQVFKIRAVCIKWSDGTINPLDSVRTEDMDCLYPSWRQTPEYGDPTLCIFRGLNTIRLYKIPNYAWASAGGAGAVITPVIVSGQITSYVVEDGGEAFTAAPNITIVGDGTGASATATITDGVITAVEPDNLGGGYTAASVTTTGGLAFEGFAVPINADWSGDGAECPLPDRAHECALLGAELKRIREFPTQENMTRRSLIQPDYDGLRAKLVREAHTAAASTREHGPAMPIYYW
jgi:hypothetical protein